MTLKFFIIIIIIIINIILLFSIIVLLMSLSLFVCHYYPCWRRFVAQSAEVMHVLARYWFFIYFFIFLKVQSVLAGHGRHFEDAEGRSC